MQSVKTDVCLSTPNILYTPKFIEIGPVVSVITKVVTKTLIHTYKLII